jgi:hypothetical protein
MLKINPVKIWGFLEQGVSPACTSQPPVELRQDTNLSAQAAAWRFATTGYAVYHSDSHTWHSVSNGKSTKTPPPFSAFRGAIYEDTPEGLFSLGKNESPELVSNATVHIFAIKEIWSDANTPERIYTLEVRSPKWGDKGEFIDIPAERYKSAYSILRKSFPDLFYSNSDSTAVEAYLTDVFTRSQAGMQHIVETEYSGWFALQGDTSYRIGRNSYYKDMRLPQIPNGTKAAIFQAGQHFLSIASAQPPITLLWMYAHLGFLLYWLKRGGQVSMFALYLRGKTGSLKTAVASEISNVFDHDRSHATIRMTSTAASISTALAMSRDTCLCIDDFSNSSLPDSRKSESNAELVIRAIGDGVLPSKMNVQDFSKIVRNTVRCAVIMTGEEKLSLGASSLLRVIEVPIDEHTFVGEHLQVFQESPEIMRNYFALFVQYLSIHGQEITAAYSRLQNIYRQEYARTFKDKRYVDAAVLLRITADTISNFAQFCGISLSCELLARLQNSIATGVNYNAQEASTQIPELRFLIALTASIDTSPNSKIALSEDTYVGNEISFVGFWEQGQDFLWIRWDSAVSLVYSYYQRVGEYWLTKESTVKERLLQQGLSKGKCKAHGAASNEYLVRAKKGQRARMLVLRMDAVQNYMKEHIS